MQMAARRIFLQDDELSFEIISNDSLDIQMGGTLSDAEREVIILIVLFGFISLFRLPIQLTPNVEDPEITVQTVWPGASPQEIEREIILEQEDRRPVAVEEQRRFGAETFHPGLEGAGGTEGAGELEQHRGQ